MWQLLNRPMDDSAEGQSVLPGRRHVGHTDPRVPGGWANITKHIVGKYKNLVGKYKNILWAKLSNIKHVVAGVWSGEVANSKIYHVDHVDGFFEKRISSCHREEGNVDCPGDKFHNDKLVREMTKMVLMIVWCISGAGGEGVAKKWVLVFQKLPVGHPASPYFQCLRPPHSHSCQQL